MMKFPCRIGVFFIIFFAFYLSGWTTSAFGKSLETVTLQLKWRHQFQFAGYYAAIEKGYYSDAGLNVKLKEGTPGLCCTDTVLSGNADYGIAMPCGGRLVIETQDIFLDQQYTETHDMNPGPYVIIAVTDFGEGMSRDVLEHIFDPFFTTKEMGKGTGLGLATVHGIVKQHNGQIYAYSEPGKGTTFKIYLPASDKAVEQDNRKKNISLPHGGETILVVDDEPSIRKLVVDTLEPLGYKCLEASCGKDAVSLVHTTEEEIHLLLTDVIMPGMSGKELAEIICVACPSIKVIFISGYTANAIAHHGILDSKANYIPKPVTPTILAEKIRSVLDG